LQLHNHQDGANCADNGDKRPEEFANADPDVRPLKAMEGKSTFMSMALTRRPGSTHVRQRKNVHGCHDGDSNSNASVDEPFREEKEKVLS